MQETIKTYFFGGDIAQGGVCSPSVNVAMCALNMCV